MQANRAITRHRHGLARTGLGRTAPTSRCKDVGRGDQAPNQIVGWQVRRGEEGAVRERTRSSSASAPNAPMLTRLTQALW